MFNASKMRKMAAPKAAAPAPIPEAPKEAPGPGGSSPTSGWIDLDKVLRDLSTIRKDPTGKDVDVTSNSKGGVHTFTIKIKPSAMLQKAEQNGAVQPQAAAPQATEAVPAPEPEPAVASSAKYVKVSSRASLAGYPEDFLKSIGM